MLVQLLPCLCLLQYLPISLAHNHEQTILRNVEGSNPLNAELEKLIKSAMEEWHVPGIAIGVFDGDNTWAKGYGIATLPSTPVTPSTLFYGASTTKAFTAAAMSNLINSANYSKHFPQAWKTPVSSIIPEDFVLEDPWATAHITIEDILSHRTGMPRHDFSYGGTYEGRNSTPRDVVRALRFLPLTEEPRVRYQYCNMMYVVAGHIIETLTGGSLESFIKKEIWKPLGMTSTSFSNADAISGPNHFAQGYVFYNNTYLPVPYTDDLVTNAAAGSIISNVLDYSKWLFALLYTSTPEEEASGGVLTPRMLHASPDVPYTGAMSYALGWETSTYKGYQFFEHSGGVEAFGSHVIFFPEIGFGVCAFGNTGVTSNVVDLIAIWRIIDERLSVKEEERFDWDAKFKRTFSKQASVYNSSLSTYYPSIPAPPLSPTLSLSSYAGTYFHPAYRNFTITHSSHTNTLHSDRLDATWKVGFNFEHVSGDYFMVYADSKVAPGFVFKQAMAAEFRVGSGGLVEKFGISLVPEMGTEGRIWFEKI